MAVAEKCWRMLEGEGRVRRHDLSTVPGAQVDCRQHLPEELRTELQGSCSAPSGDFAEVADAAVGLRLVGKRMIQSAEGVCTELEC